MIITLTTDFGVADPFVGIMKGVILGIAPDVHLVDVTHDIRSYDIVEAAFVIENAYRYFPERTIHIVVVDPGVGSARRPIAAAAKGHTFVAPDNGVLSFVLDAEPGGTAPAAFHVTNKRLFLSSVSQTFHGRDIFAPVAAHLASGAPIESVGPRVPDFVRKPMPDARAEGRKVLGVVLRVDKYGNVITNLRPQHLGTHFAIGVAGFSITRLCESFSEAGAGELFAIEGSTGYIELALNQGSAADLLSVERGAEIEVETRV